jgi:hypothetical protein
MTSTLNRCNVGDVVYLYDKSCIGEVVSTSTLGLPFAPVVQTPDGSRIFYCGDNLKNCCSYAPVFVKALEDLSFSQNDIDRFLTAWFNTDRETQRSAYFAGLQEALKSTDTEILSQFITDLNKVIIG